MKFTLTVAVLLMCIRMPGLSQDAIAADFQQIYQLHITRTNAPINIDGEFNEPAWANAGTANDFWRKYPNDNGKATRKTEVKMLFDDNFIYFAFTAYDSGKVVIQSLKRDIGHDNNDGVAIILDPLNQRLNGFFFVLNAYNAQSEDQLHYGNDLTYSWDNKWYSATKRFKDRWTAEIAIPFKTLRYSSEKKSWGLNFVRIDQKNFEYSTWTHVPVNFRSYDLGYNGALVWDELPPKAGSNTVLIPYVTGGRNQDKENNVPSKNDFNAGFDAKFGLTSALNLDLTVNPDFSQVEVDQQVTNLTRYNIFLPEKRSFFLENSDLFGGYGIAGLISPFYSRSIGLDAQGNRIPIIGGARLSGDLTKSTRIGIMNMQTATSGAYYAENFSAVSVNQTVFQRSIVRGYFLDRESFEPGGIKQSDPMSRWGRNAGLEFDYSNLAGSWKASGAYNQSFKPGISRDDKYLNVNASYNKRNIKVTLSLTDLGTNYYTDMGYVSRISNYDAVRDTSIRVGFKNINNEIMYSIFPSSGKIGQHIFDLVNTIYLNPDNSLNERSHNLSYNLFFNNSVGIIASILTDQLNLLFPISFTGGTPLPKGPYSYNQYSLAYYSDIRKLFSFTARAGTGGFYNGTLQTIAGSINWRSQPHVNLSIQAEYDKLAFPGSYGSTELFLISPKIEINFSTKMFWTTFLQYNTQQNNYNINSRFQYRYKPMSDLYLVYTDNYFTSPFLKNKNRAIVFKLNYWLNI